MLLNQIEMINLKVMSVIDCVNDPYFFNPFLDSYFLPGDFAVTLNRGKSIFLPLDYEFSHWSCLGQGAASKCGPCILVPPLAHWWQSL